MRPKVNFDPMFESSRRWPCWPVHAIGLALAVAASGGPVLRAGPIEPGGPGSPAGQVVRATRGKIDVRGSVPALRDPRPRAAAVQRRDPFAIIAPAEIDPRMVIPARRDLDVEMVFNPDAGRRGSPQGGPAPAGDRMGPGPVPGSAPDEARLFRSSPQPPLFPRAR